MVKSAERAIRILETVAQFSAGLTHTEISHSLHIPSGSLTPLLTTLSQLGYLSLHPPTKRYLLSTGVLSLSRRYQEGLDIVRTGEPFLIRLVEMTGEASAITIENGNRSTVVAKVNARLPLSPSLNLGDSAPLYAGASGRIYLASRSNEEINRYLSTVHLKPFTAKTPTDPVLQQGAHFRGCIRDRCADQGFHRKGRGNVHHQRPDHSVGTGKRKSRQECSPGGFGRALRHARVQPGSRQGEAEILTGRQREWRRQIRSTKSEIRNNT